MCFKSFFYLSAMALLMMVPSGAVAGNPHMGTAGFLGTLLKKTDEIKLYERKYWNVLLHYRGNRSVITDPAFFLAETGGESPRDELIATLRAFFGNDPRRQSLICKYPARYTWLCSQLGIDPQGLRNRACIDLKTYLDHTAIKSVSLSFASESFKNVGSLMGHLFIRIDGERDGRATSHALSYYATLDSLNFLSVYYRAVFSGLDGMYMLRPYAEQIKEYNAYQRRNLVDFPLALTSDQLEAFILHVWELKGINITYNFFSNNCGTGIMDALYAADPGLEQNYHVFDTPKDIVGRMIKSGHVTRMKLRPTVEYEIRQLSQDLSLGERRLVKNILTEKKLDALSQVDSGGRRQKILLVVRAAIRQISLNDGELTEALAALLQEIDQQIDPEIKSDILEKQLADYKDNFNFNNSSNLSVGFLHSGENALRLCFSPVYNNLNSNNTEYLREFRLHVMRVSATYYTRREKMIVEEIELINFKQIIPQNALTGGLSGEFKISLEQEGYGASTDRLYPDALFGAGVSQSLLRDQVVCYLLLRGGGAYYKKSGVAYASPEGGLFFRGKRGKVHAYAKKVYATTHYKFRRELGLANTLYIKKNHDINLSIKEIEEYDGSVFPQYALQYNYYF